MTAEEYLGDWLNVMDKIALDEVLHVVGMLYKKGKNICPKQGDVFKAFNLTPYRALRAVYLFQDPYPQPGIATGVAVGNKDTPDNKISPSLKIIKEAVISYKKPQGFITFDNSLESWSKQGILMLNTALTVEADNIGSHAGIWRPFTAHLLENISKETIGVVFALFGGQAQSFEKYIDPQFSFILKEKHPAYYVRTHTKMPDTIFRETDRIFEASGDSMRWYEDDMQLI